MLSGTSVWTAFILYSLVVIIIGIYAWRNQEIKTSQNYYVGKGSIGTLVLIMTYIASLMSTWVFFAGPGGYYRAGLVYFFSELSYIPLFPVIAYFVMNKVWLLNSQRNYVTPADVYDDRFRSPALRVILAVIFLAVTLPYVASVLVACGKAADSISGGAMSYHTTIIVLTVSMLIYMVLGGMRSVAWTDTLQGWVFITVLWVIVFSVLKIGFDGSLASAVSNVWFNSNSWFSYPGPDKWMPYSARLGYPLNSAIGWTIMLPHVFIRAGYSGKDLVMQRKLLGYIPVLQVLVWSGTMLIGLLGISLVPGLSTGETEMIIPFLIESIIQPYGPALANILMILFFIGAVAVGMSTANSFLLVAGSIISEDFLEKIFKLKMSYDKKMVVARVIIIILGILSMFLAFDPPALIWTLIQFSISLVMPLFPVLVVALYWRRATAVAAIVASLVGTVIVLLTYYWGLGELWYGTFGLVASTVLVIVVSYFSPQTDKKVLDDFYGALKKAENIYYAN